MNDRGRKHPSGPPVLSIRGLSVCFASGGSWVWANRQVDLDVAAGEIVALVGESGSGKTTVFKAITGLLDGLPGGVSGTICFKGNPFWPEGKHLVEILPHDEPRQIRKNVTRWEVQHRKMVKRFLGKRIGLVFQEPTYSLDPRQTVMEQFETVCRRHLLHGFGVQAKHRLGKILDELGLDISEIGRKRSHEMSGGECQRVALALALLPGPELLLCDEPTTAVDVEVRDDLHRVLRQFVQADGKSVLLISHCWLEVKRLADRVVFMDGGETLEWVACRFLDNGGGKHVHPGTDLWRRGGHPSLTPANDNNGIPPHRGCPLVDRCPEAAAQGREFQSRCAGERVPSFRIGPGHTVRCWLFS